MGERTLADHVADLMVYAPLGLALDARRLLPELAARGRRQVLLTHTIGKYAVRRGRARVDGLAATGVALVTGLVGNGASAPVDGGDDVALEDAPTRPPLRAVEPALDCHHLAIPDYDSLSAFQVMPRLEALDSDDLAAVRDYEEATRGRRTILNKIAQLS